MQTGFPQIKLIAVGKVKKPWLQEGLAIYLQRLPELDIIEIKNSSPDREATQMLSLVKASDHLIALTETGQSLSSVALADWLSNAASNTLVFALGSAEGLSDRIIQAATQCLSLSAMTFPHEIARLLLVEQLYRAKTIIQGSPYHK